MEEIKQSYKQFLERMKSNGWTTKIICLHNNTKIVTKSRNSILFRIECPSRCIMTLPPSLLNSELQLIYGFELKLIMNDGKEVDGNTLIKIEKTTSTILSAYAQIDELMYYNIRYRHSTLYHPKIGILLNSEEQLVFIVPDEIVDKLDIEKCELHGKMDLFEILKNIGESKLYRKLIENIKEII